MRVCAEREREGVSITRRGSLYLHGSEEEREKLNVKLNAGNVLRYKKLWIGGYLLDDSLLTSMLNFIL